MHKIEFTKTVKCSWDLKKINNIVEIVAKTEKKLKKGTEIVVIGDKRIKNLNRVYRGINKPTDVLAFCWAEEQKFSNDILGQVYISYPQIKRQSKKFKVSIKEEFTRILIHGLLHLVGYDHITKEDANKMFNLQEKLLKEII